MNTLFVIILEIVFLGGILFLNLQNSWFADQLLSSPLIAAINGFLILLLGLDLATKLFINYYIKRRPRLKNRRYNIISGIRNIKNVLIFMAFVLTLFQAMGVDLKTLLTSLSIVAAALAIILKEFIGDFLIGLYFSFAKDFEIGDYVRIGNHYGRITEISMQKVRIRNDDDHVVILPHSKVYANDFVNITKKDIRLTSIDFQLDIKTIGNIELLESELVSALIDYSHVIEPDSYALIIKDVKKDHIDFKFQYKIKNLDNKIQKQIRKVTVRKIFNYVALKRHPNKGIIQN